MTPDTRVPPSPHPGADLLEVVTVALEREGHLLTAGEALVARRLAALDPEALELYARLSVRVGPVFRVAALRYGLDVPAAVARLVAAGLAVDRVPDARCAPAFDVPALKDACRRLALPVGGTRGELEARLAGRRWVEEPVVALAHLRLVRRLELLYFQRPELDRGHLVAERLGALRWATYVPTGGSGLFPDRRALRRYERARAGEWEEGEALAVALAGRPEVGLSPWRRAVEAVVAARPDADTLGRLEATGAPLRHARALALEREGRPTEALAACRVPAEHPEAVPLARTGRRLARRLGEAWTPHPPLREAPVRRFWLVPAGRAAARPLWAVDGRALPVEAALVRRLAVAGRAAVHAENALWTTLFALVFREAYFLPVPGMLPTPRLAAPLDLGRPGFHLRRRAPTEALLRRVAAEGPAPFLAAWSGERLTGLWADPAWLALAATVPGPMAAAVLERLLAEGWAAARGLPDLYVPPGPEVRLEGAIPARVPAGARLAEVKGPGDTLRDDQRRWHHRLLEASVPVEIWMVESVSLDAVPENPGEESSAASAPD